MPVVSKRKMRKEPITKLAQMRQKLASLERAVARQKRLEEKMHKWSHELRERSKELGCIYGISRVVDNTETSDEIVQGIVNLIPSSWQYPGIACARATIGDRQFATRRFKETPYTQSSDIIVHGKKVGTLKVCYLEKRPDCDEGPFLKSERNLLDVIAERMGKTIGHKRALEELKSSQKKLRNLFERAQTIREEERKDMARKVHDNLGQGFTGLKMDVQWMIKHLPKGRTRLLEKVRSIERLIDTMTEDTQGIASELRPPMLDDLGLSELIISYVEAFHKRSGIRCEVVLKPRNIALGKDLSLMIFRIIQELLTNVIRHANATETKVRLEKKKGRVELKVADNGIGITRERALDYKSFGLLSIQERVSYWGGNLEISGPPNRGSTVVVRVPSGDQREER